MTTVQIYSCATFWKWEIIAEYPLLLHKLFRSLEMGMRSNNEMIWKWEADIMQYIQKNYKKLSSWTLLYPKFINLGLSALHFSSETLLK